MPPSFSRRNFMLLGAAAAARLGVQAQSSVTRANVGTLDSANILAQAKLALNLSVAPPPSRDFHSEVEPVLSTAGGLPRPKLFRAEALALGNASAAIGALTAAYLLNHEGSYAQKAIAFLNAWLVAPGSSLHPEFSQAGCLAGTSTSTPAGIVDLVPLAEMARAASFLTDDLTPEQLRSVQDWFAATLHWLTDNRQASIAQEAKDHRASAHLLLCAAFARFLRDEGTLEDCRKRFRTHTLRNQIHNDGTFPQEVATPNPYRNTLFNFDLLGGACQLLSSPFDLLWDYELIDGVGLRIVAAYLYPVLAQPERWGFPADAQYFRELPGRRPALLFSGRAYNRPEYVELWHKRPAAPPEALADTFPIRQPSLWTARAPHGL